MKFKVKPLIATLLTVSSVFAMLIAVNNSKDNSYIKPDAAGSNNETKRVWVTTDETTPWWYNDNATFGIETKTGNTYKKNKMFLEPNNKYVKGEKEYDIYFFDVPFETEDIQWYRQMPDGNQYDFTGFKNYSDKLFVVAKPSSFNVHTIDNFTFNITKNVQDLVDCFENITNLDNHDNALSILNRYSLFETYDFNKFDNYVFPNLNNMTGQQLMNYYYGIYGDNNLTIRVWVTIYNDWWLDHGAINTIKVKNKLGNSTKYTLIKDNNNKYTDTTYDSGNIYYFDVPIDSYEFSLVRINPNNTSEEWTKTKYIPFGFDINEYSPNKLVKITYISDNETHDLDSFYTFLLTENVNSFLVNMEKNEVDTGVCKLENFLDAMTTYQNTLSTYEKSMYTSHEYIEEVEDEDDIITTGLDRINYLNRYHNISINENNSQATFNSIKSIFYVDKSLISILFVSFSIGVIGYFYLYKKRNI